MARYLGPRKKLERRFGIIPDKKASERMKKKRKSGYGQRLEEKQKLKFIYGILEKQLRRYVEEAKKAKEPAPDALLKILEMRLDNVVYRLGFARTRQQARQFVSHRHILVDGNIRSIPSRKVGIGETIAIHKKMLDKPRTLEMLEELKKKEFPGWLLKQNGSGKILTYPETKELRKDIDISKIIEYYS